MPAVYRQQLFDHGSDMSMEMLEDWNALERKTNPRLLDNLIEPHKTFRDRILPGPAPNPNGPQQPQQVLPPLPPPQPKPLKSVLRRDQP